MNTLIAFLLIFLLQNPMGNADKLKNKAFVYEVTENPELLDCPNLGGTDCLYGYLLFGENQEVIFSQICCCDESESYSKGDYKIENDNVIVTLYSNGVDEWDSKIKFEDVPSSEKLAKLKSVLVKSSKTTLYFKIKYCAQKKMYLQESKKTIYATLAKDSYQTHLKRLKDKKAVFNLLNTILPD